MLFLLIISLLKSNYQINTPKEAYSSFEKIILNNIDNIDTKTDKLLTYKLTDSFNIFQEEELNKLIDLIQNKIDLVEDEKNKKEYIEIKKIVKTYLDNDYLFKLNELYLNKDFEAETKFIIKNILLSYLLHVAEYENIFYSSGFSKTFYSNNLIRSNNFYWLEFFKIQIESLLMINYTLSNKNIYDDKLIIDDALDKVCPKQTNLNYTKVNNKLFKFCNENGYLLRIHAKNYLKKTNKKYTLDEILNGFNIKINELNRILSTLPINNDYCDGLSDPLNSKFINTQSFGSNYDGKSKMYKDINLSYNQNLNFNYYKQSFAGFSELPYGVLLFTNAMRTESKENNYYNQQMRIINPSVNFINLFSGLSNVFDEDIINKDTMFYLACNRKHEYVNITQIEKALLELEKKIIYFIQNEPLVFDDYNENFILNLIRYNPYSYARVLKNIPSQFDYIVEVLQKINSIIKIERKKLFATRMMGIGAFVSSLIAIPFSAGSSANLALISLSTLMSLGSFINELNNIRSINSKIITNTNTTCNTLSCFSTAPDEQKKLLSDDISYTYYESLNKHEELIKELGISKAFIVLDAATSIIDIVQFSNVINRFCKIKGIKRSINVLEYEELSKLLNSKYENELLSHIYNEVNTLSPEKANIYLKNLNSNVETLSKIKSTVNHLSAPSRFVKLQQIKYKLYSNSKVKEIYSKINKNPSIKNKHFRSFIDDMAEHIIDDVSISGKNIDESIIDAISYFEKYGGDVFRFANTESIPRILSRFEKILAEDDFKILKGYLDKINDNKFVLRNRNIRLMDNKTKKYSRIIDLETDDLGNIKLTETITEKNKVITNIKELKISENGELLIKEKVIYKDAKGNISTKYLSDIETKSLDDLYQKVRQYCM